MKLVLLTSHYPYSGEPFLENEIALIGHSFSEIVVFPLMYHGEEKLGDIPNNVHITHIRKQRIKLDVLISAALKMLSLRTWRERRFAYRKLGYKKKKLAVNRAILIDYYTSALIAKALRKIPVGEDTVIYSYWLDHGAFFYDFKKKHPEVKCISRTHGGDCYINKFYQPFRRELLSCLDAVYPISDAGKNCLEELILPHISGKHAEMAVQRLGTIKISDKMNPGAAENEAFEIVTCSNVIPLKRLDLMIGALSQIHDWDIQWTHFGDGERMEDIQRLADVKLSGVTNVKYEFKGHIPKDDILRWYEQHHVDLFVNCSDSEGVPVSIMEAFSYGIPVIARNVGGNGEIVENGVNGFLLPEECTAEMLSNAILKFMQLGEELVNSLREKAYSTFDEKYNAAINYLEFYRCLNLPM